MIPIFTKSDWDELYKQAPVTWPKNLILDDFETVVGVSQYLGRGYYRSMELLPGVWLEISDEEFHQDWRVKAPAHEHLVQCSVFLSGRVHGEEMYPTFGGERSYFSGSGIAPPCTVRHERSQPLIGINIELLPEVFEEFFAGMTGANTALLRLILKQNDWKVSFFPGVTSALRLVAQQILDSPFCGVTRRLYLQEKVFDLLTLQLEAILADQGLAQAFAGRKSERIVRIYHAKEILASRLENPPSLIELARQVGVSDCTLRRGFQDVFGTTVVGYLTKQRMQYAERLLQEGNHTVAEVANRVGYAHLGHFAAGFKRQFGISPRDCLTDQTVGTVKQEPLGKVTVIG